MNPTGDRPYKARALVQPFGIRRAPENWGRVVTFSQLVASEALGLATGAFADDVFCAESHRIATSGFRASKQLCALVGPPTSPKKDQIPTTNMVLLVADVALRNTRVRAQIRSDRAERLKDQIRTIRKKNLLSPAVASKLRGVSALTRPCSPGNLVAA